MEDIEHAATNALVPAPGAGGGAIVVTQAEADRLKKTWLDSLAPATRTAYRKAWNAWMDWATGRGAGPLPAEPVLVALYLNDRFDRGAGMATLRMACAAISSAHDHAGHDTPCKRVEVRKAMQGLARRAAGTPVRQASALTEDRVNVIRGHFSDKAKTNWRAARDLAIVSVLAEGGLRRSEAAALQWKDIAAEPDKSGRIEIRRSKTDQTGRGAVVAIAPSGMADIERYRRHCAALFDTSPTASVFRLTDGQIARRVKVVVDKAGIAAGGVGFSGHSGRVGMAQTMATKNAGAPLMMTQGRWASTEMVSRYTRRIKAGEAVAYIGGRGPAD